MGYSVGSMSNKAGKSENPNDSGPDNAESEGGLVPAILAGAGILAVVGLLVFWPSDDGATGADGEDKIANGGRDGGRAGAAGAGASARGGGGVGQRAVDEPTPGALAAQGKVNAKLLPSRVGMAPGIPVEEPPPKFNNVQDEIAWYEKRLVRAEAEVQAREKNVSRLAAAKRRAEDDPQPDAALAKFEADKKIVEGNLAKAKAKVDQVENKLAELRGE